jgi:hypothetical protein
MSISGKSRRALCGAAIIAMLTGCSSTGTLTYVRPSTAPTGKAALSSLRAAHAGAHHGTSRPQRSARRYSSSGT